MINEIRKFLYICDRCKKAEEITTSLPCPSRPPGWVVVTTYRSDDSYGTDYEDLCNVCAKTVAKKVPR